MCPLLWPSGRVYIIYIRASSAVSRPSSSSYGHTRILCGFRETTRDVYSIRHPAIRATCARVQCRARVFGMYRAWLSFCLWFMGCPAHCWVQRIFLCKRACDWDSFFNRPLFAESLGFFGKRFCWLTFNTRPLLDIYEFESIEIFVFASCWITTEKKGPLKLVILYDDIFFDLL